MSAPETKTKFPSKAQAKLLYRIRRGESLLRANKSGIFVLLEKNGSGHGVKAVTANVCLSRGWIAEVDLSSACTQMRLTDKGDDALGALKGVRRWLK